MITIAIHTKLTVTERTLISEWLKEHVSKKECARRLGRDIKTVRRELHRNSFKVATRNDWQQVYEPLHAQAVSEKRKYHAYQAKHPLKNKKIYQYVLKQLRRGWSPEQIAGRLKNVLHPDNPSWHICHETIYQFIYKPKTDLTRSGWEQQRVFDRRKVADIPVTVTDYERPLWEYLRRKQVRRKARQGRTVRRVRIPDRVSIHDRPEVIAQRTQFGHWEGDSVVGRNHTSGLHTEYERVSSLIRIERMNRITAEEMVQAATCIFGPLPPAARLSTTLDNGSEHTRHHELHTDLGMETYFADPYSSWQRGGNENANLWIRYYFPKGTDFSTISLEELKDVEWELNNRPRKRLNYKTPLEVFNEYLGGIRS